MYKTYTTQIVFSAILCFIVVVTTGQSQRKSSSYVFGQYSKTLYDFTKQNNLSSFGLGLQTFFQTKTPFKPSVELTGDFIYLDDKVLRINTNGSEIPTVTSMVTLFAGSAFQFNRHLYVSLMAGPAYVSNRLLPGIKPSLGFYFDKSQKFTGKISYINIFNRYKPTGEDYGSVSLALGIKVY